MQYQEKVRLASNELREAIGNPSCIRLAQFDLYKHPKVGHGDMWGDWVLNLEPADNPSLDYVGRYYRNNPYWIRLSELQTWQGLNHWMHHLNGKDWGRESMGDFVNAVMTVSNLPWPGNATSKAKER